MSRRRSRRQRRSAASAPEIPAAFRGRMTEMLGTETAAFLDALATPAAGLRVNTLRLPVERFREISPFELAPLPFPPEGFIVPDDLRPGAHPYHAAGLYYLQDPGAMVVGALPELPPDARVLDLAAAPGGKATHLAARMEGRGVLVANDVHAGRARELASNLERCGVRNAIVTSESPSRLAAQWGGWFDLVIVDAPCSGESMFHKSEAARREWSAATVRGCARRQGELLRDAIELVRPGGVLIYSTCTFAPEENEAVLAELLAGAVQMEMQPIREIAGASPARPEWAGPGADPGVAGAMRLWPHRFPGAGHFIAALRRSADGTTPVESPANAAPGEWEPPSGEALQVMRDFLAENVPGTELRDGRVSARGEDLYRLPDPAPPLADLRTLRAGCWLGSTRKGRFEPSHSLAMAITIEEAADALVLASTSPSVEAYLRGETLREPGPDGWVLVTVDGYPLGWGKRSGGVVKNHYPKGLRRR